jgi:hypothetical protein
MTVSDLLHQRPEACDEEAAAGEGQGGGGERGGWRRGGEGVGGRGDEDPGELEGEGVLEEGEAHVAVVHDAQQRLAHLPAVLRVELHRRLQRRRSSVTHGDCARCTHPYLNGNGEAARVQKGCLPLQEPWRRRNPWLRGAAEFQ